MGSGDPPLYGSAHGGRSPMRLYAIVPLPGRPAATLAAACALHASIPIPALYAGEEELGLSAPLA